MVRHETAARDGVAMRRSALALTCAGIALAAQAAPPQRVLVVCAPGSPGTTLQAQATMDGFAQSAAAAAGWPAGSLSAIYFENLESGVARLREPDAALAMVSLPFFLRYEKELALRPRLEAHQESGAREVWSLVAKKDAVGSAAALAGWEITGGPGFYPEFVRGAILADWGRIPNDTRISFTSRALTALRRAATGEKLAVILGLQQTGAVPELPFGDDLVVVTSSAPLPGGYLCTVGDRLGESEAGALGRLIGALEKLDKSDEGRATLQSLMMARFAPVDAAALSSARKATGSPAGAAH